jgi:hypothetical protein
MGIGNDNLCFIYLHIFLPILLSGVGATCFSSCCDKDSAIIFTTGRLTSTLLETGVQTTANAAGTNGLTCLPKHGGARDNKFLVTRPMTDQSLSFRNRKPSVLTEEPSNFSGAIQQPKYNMRMLYFDKCIFLRPVA